MKLSGNDKWQSDCGGVKNHADTNNNTIFYERIENWTKH